MLKIFSTLLLLLSTASYADYVHLTDYNYADPHSINSMIYGAKKIAVAPTSINPDPFEKINRKIYKFNDKLDSAILKPIARGYRKVIPKPVRTGVNNVFSNLDDVFVITNDILQFKAKQTLQDTARFLINSTIGLAGIFDVASKMGLPKHEEDFGQTLGKWGFQQGPYIVLPILGPSSGRHLTGKIAHWTTANNTTVKYKQKDIYLYGPVRNLNPKNHQLGFQVLDKVALRESVLDAEETLSSIAIDKYATLRDAFLQNRRYVASDGTYVEKAVDFESEELAGLDGLDEDELGSSELTDKPQQAIKQKPQENLEEMLEDDDDLVE